MPIGGERHRLVLFALGGEQGSLSQQFTMTHRLMSPGGVFVHNR